MGFSRKVICIVSAAILCLGLSPLSAFAENDGELVAAQIDAELPAAVTATIAKNYDVDGVTLLDSRDYAKWMSYNDDETNQLGWGQVEIAEYIDPASEVHYWFVTDPDPKHVHQVRCTLVDFDTSKDSVTLDIPGQVSIDVNRDGAIGEDEVYITTSIGYASGSDYRTPSNSETNVILDSEATDRETALGVDKHDIRYWYTSVNEFMPSWAFSATAQGHVCKQHETAKAFVTVQYAKQHPFLDGAGSNNTLFAPQYCQRYVLNDEYSSVNDYAASSISALDAASKVNMVIVPASVKEISGYSFSGCSMLASIQFGDGSPEGSDLENIGQGAFQGTIVKRLVLPDSFKRLDNIQYKTNNVTNVNDYSKAEEERWSQFVDANGDFITINDTDKLQKVQTTGGVFALASSLETVSLPANVSIDLDAKVNGKLVAFVSLSNLQAFEVRGENPLFKVYDGVLYSVDCSQVLAVPNRIKQVTIPASANIGEAFKQTDVQEVEFEQGITEVPANAFYSCGQLQIVTLPDSINTINVGAFKDCSSLALIQLPESLTSIGTSAFENCTALTGIEFPKSLSSIGEIAFQNCTHLEIVTLPPEIKTISTAFNYCANLNYLLAESPDVMTVGKSAFKGCTSLKRLVLLAKQVTMQSGANNKGKKFATPFAGAAWNENDAAGAVDKLSIVFVNEVESLEFNGTFNNSGWTLASGEHEPFFLAKALNVYSFGGVLKDYFLDSSGEIDTSNVSLHYGDDLDVTVTYIDINEKIVKIGAGITSATLAGVPTEGVTYTGSAIEPAITVTYGSGDDAVTLVEGTDYMVAYANNMKPGTATVTVTGMGDYVGTLSADFTIVDTEDGQAAADEAAVQSLLSDIAALPGTDAIMADDADAIAAVDAAVNAYMGMNDAQKADIGVDALQKLVEAQAKVAEVKEQIAKDAQEKAKADKEAAEREAAEAKAAAEQLKKDVEAAKAEAAAAKAEAAAAKAKAAEAPAALAKVTLTKKTKSAKKGRVTVAWKKVAGATGYEVKVGAKTYTVKKASTLKKTVKAAKGKKVKVQVRAFKKVGDNYQYGPWSKAKKVKVKK